MKMIPINNYESYLICENGDVISLPKKVGRFSGFYTKQKHLKPCMDRDGYLRVGLCNNSKVKVHTVHRLVASHFLPNPYNLPQINHINGIKHDNRIENLEWCTAQHNVRHAHRMGLSTMDNLIELSRQRKGVLSARATRVGQYSIDGTLIKEWDYIKLASDSLNIPRMSISATANGRQKSGGGFKWQKL